MDILIGFAVAALKAGVSGVVGNEIVQALADQGIDIGSDKLSQYLEKSQKELSQVLSDKSLMKMNVPEDYIDYIKEEIKGLLRRISIDEDLFRNCHYDAKSLAEALYKKYKGQKRDFVECEREIQKVLYVMSEKAILLEKGRDGFTADILTDILNNQEEQMELIRKIWSILDESMKNRTTYLENEQKQDQNKRLPDRTEEYRRKWTENMFLNDFDEDDEDAGVNIPLHKLYQLPFYRPMGQKEERYNLEERLDICTDGQDLKKRMLLILGQPGMGKSTLITWFLTQYEKKHLEDKKEVLVYRFTDLEINWSFNFDSESGRDKGIDNAILKCLNMKKEDLNGKILILDGFDEVAAGNNRTAILNSLYNAWAKEALINNFSLLITCRENYIENLSHLLFKYITLQPWNEMQIERFCENYGAVAKIHISKEAISKMKSINDVFGIPIILYMALALDINVRDDSSVVEVYDQIFNLEKGGLYDRCLKRGILRSYDKAHRIAIIKKQIHQFSREISMWMFENRSDKSKQPSIPKNEYEKIQDKIFEKYDSVGKSQKKDVLIGNYFQMVRCFDGIGTDELTFVHRTIYEYFVAEMICTEIAKVIDKMSEDEQEKLAGVLGYRLKKGRIDYTIGQYLKTKVSTLIATYSKEKKNYFYVWLEGIAGKMFNDGMLYYTGKNIKEYRNVMEKEINVFLNLLDVLKLFLDLSDRKYILQDISPNRIALYIRYLTSLKNMEGVDLSGIDLSGANLSGAYLKNVNLRGANLSGAYLDDANLSDANLSGAYLKNVNLRGANLSRVNLRRVNLSGVDLSRVDLSGIDLSGVNLRGTNLREASLRGANLNGADLSKADLRGTDLSGANLSGATLDVKNIEESIWSQGALDIYWRVIRQCEFRTIYSRAEKTGKKRMITRSEFLARCPD